MNFRRLFQRKEKRYKTPMDAGGGTPLPAEAVREGAPSPMGPAGGGQPPAMGMWSNYAVPAGGNEQPWQPATPYSGPTVGEGQQPSFFNYAPPMGGNAPVDVGRGKGG